jgi:lipoprotein-anchoring transpeptidase ErfK/SrfK
MSYTYNQSTGKFCNDNTGKCTQSYSGYKGETDQTKKNLGPIPEGKYTIANSCDKTGGKCNLTPDSSNKMSGRSGFQIHGDNNKGDQSASHGCIILNQKDRAGLKPGDKVTVKK